VRSIASKIDELSVVVSINQIDIVCITETFLYAIPDSAISLPNFNVIRNDRSSSCGGGVCIFINNSIYCQRLTAFEDPTVESLWLLVRPTWLPCLTSVILLAVIDHSTSAGHTENVNLYSHIQTNVDTFMQSHPDALVLITGDFNYRSIGFNAKYIQRSIGLFQIIKVHTRDNVTLDWCLTNRNDSLYDPIKLPPLGNSDHNMVCLKSLNPPLKPDKVKVWKRDLRESSLQPFGRDNLI
jgi:hypothetical protein